MSCFLFWFVVVWPSISFSLGLWSCMPYRFYRFLYSGTLPQYDCVQNWKLKMAKPYHHHLVLWYLVIHFSSVIIYDFNYPVTSSRCQSEGDTESMNEKSFYDFKFHFCGLVQQEKSFVEYVFSGFDCSIGNFTKIYCSPMELLFFKQTHKIGYRFYEMMQSQLDLKRQYCF
jgi:hypothetical protein